MSANRSGRMMQALRCGIVVLLAGLGLAVPAVAQDDANENAATLQWLNGDELPGQIVGATKDRLTWRSPALAQDISLDLSSLLSIRAPEGSTPARAAGPMQAQLTNGDIIGGELRAITPNYIELASKRHGVTRIGRSWVARIKRASAFDAIDLVRSRGKGWQSVDARWEPLEQEDAELVNWQADDRRQVSTATPGARLFQSMEMPDFCHIELDLESLARPAFSFAIGSIKQLQGRRADLMLETWGDELVIHSATAPGRFAHLLRLTDETKQLRLHIVWDRDARKLLVYDDLGRSLAEATVRTSDNGESGGVALENKGGSLAVNTLRIDTWIGNGPRDAIGRQDWVRAADGSIYSGKISDFDADGRLVIASADGRENRISRRQIVEIVFPRTVSTYVPLSASELMFDDGTSLRGELLSIAGGVARLKTPYAERPIGVRIEGLSSCTFPNQANSQASQTGHVLEYRGSRLHGTLAAAGASLGWRPDGSDDAIPLETGAAWKIERVDESDDDDARLRTDLDVAYLRNGDQFPCHVRAIGEDFVFLESGISQAGKIPQSAVHAIEFGAESLNAISGFGDREWAITGNQPQMIQRTPERVVFRGQAQIQHPHLLQGGSCEFDVEWSENSQTVFMINLVPEQGRRQLGSQMFYLVFSNESVVVHMVSGQNVRQQNKQLRADRGNAMRLRLQVIGDNVEMWADDEIVGKMPLMTPASPPVGVILGCQRINVVVRGAAIRGNKQSPLVAISNMRSGRGSGLFRSAALAGAERERVVTVPRSRRNRPPTHLLVAQNGDVLRGELLALGPTSTQFRSRMDDVIIPRDRLTGIVWLSEQDDEPVAVKESSAGNVQAMFENGVVLEFTPQTVIDNKIVGAHPVLGTCHLSLDEIRKLRSGRAEPASDTLVFSEWTLVPAREPVIPDPSDSSVFGTHSQLVGEQAEDFSLKMLDGGQFRLSDHQDKIVVLDFWTTWCGPCIRALPELIQATAEFSPRDVVFVAVNQQENTSVVQKFLDNRDWDLNVALDLEGEVGRKFQLEGFPQTVVIGRDGKIEHVRLGYSPNLQEELTDTLRQLLEASGAADE